MSAAVSIESGVLDGYRARLAGPEAVDELVTADGLRADQASLAATVDALGLAGLQAARAEARQFADDEGITYGTTASGGVGRSWAIDPIPVVIGASEWTALETGLRQRAVLLDLVLTDLYGDRRLIRERLLPPEVVLAHDGFVRQTDRIGVPGRRQLVIAATDLGRAADGGWRVISDRTQAPSGPGYAMATRRIISRVMAGLHRVTSLARLRGFFQAMTGALQDASPAPTEPPRVVLLSPGPGSETAFEQAYLATLLGFPLVEADDLVMHEGTVWLRSGSRLEQVDVLLRRVDAWYADPLELRGDSQLGVPGLVEATRRGKVAVVNPIGAGVLENPGLLPFLGEASRLLLGEEPLLDAPQTWWCGEPAARGHVLTNLDRLAIKPISRSHGPVRYGWLLTAGELDDLRARIATEPWAWCGQEPLSLSTAPVVTRSGLEPRRFVLRTFGVAHADDYVFLPGGLGRVASRSDEHTVSNYTGALAKDVWVISTDAETVGVGVGERRLSVPPIPRATGLSPRVADNLYWMGRYAERAEGTARLLKVADDFAEDHSSRPGTAGAEAMRVLLQTVGNLTVSGLPDRDETPVGYLRGRVLDADRRGTVLWCAQRLVEAAHHVRDLLSVDTWSVLGRLQHTLAQIPDADDQLQPLLADVLESLLALAGIMAHSMVRDESWAFLDSGGRMERAQLTVSLLRNTLCTPHGSGVDALVVEGVLRAGESIITHRRRAAAGTGPSDPLESAIDLLLLDRINPRSVLNQVESLAVDLKLLGDEASSARALGVVARLDAVDLAVLPGDPDALAALLDAVQDELRALSEELTGRHFVRQAPRHTLRTDWSTPWQVT